MCFCEICGKTSCNASGDGDAGCPTFLFGLSDFPICAPCNQEQVYGDQDDEEDDAGDDEE